MNAVDDRPLIPWDRRQWADGSTAIPPAETGPRWSLWQWVGQRPSERERLGVGDSALSGFGHNPSGQHWAEASRQPGPRAASSRPGATGVAGRRLRHDPVGLASTEPGPEVTSAS